MSKRVCCMSLHTAGIAIGCLESIWSLLKIVGLSIILKHFLNNEKDNFDIVVIFSTFLAITAIKVICSILLLVGTTKNHHFLLLPWIIATVFDILFIFGSTIYRLCISAPNEPGQQLLFMMSFGLTMGVNLFIYNTIFALYNHIKDIRKQQLPMTLENEDL